MGRFATRFWVLATALAALAGYVDAIGFLTAGGVFVAFMSGNSTQFAVALATGVGPEALAGGLVGTFVAGVVAGTLAATVAGRWRKPAVLALVAVMLVAAGVAAQAAGPVAAAFVLAAAMGAENAVFQRDGEVAIGLTYMTGTLVKLGQRLAAALTGGQRWAWVPHLLLWCALVAGAIVGALAYRRLGADAIWPAAGAAALCALVARLLGPAAPVSPSGRAATTA